ncbi:MAG TPA: hypothetical protein VHJ77_09835 [Vicinamibacterales bacterium]|jgi:hypothetical protein|nr:hypothetical protein [Vicinamibacterales bacterium]
MLVTRRFIVPVWVVVVGLVGLFQPSTTLGANLFLLVVVGIMTPAIWFVLLSLPPHAPAAGRSERRRK